MLQIATSIVLMALLQWAAVRYVRSKSRVRSDASREETSVSGASRLSIWQALRQELLAWLIVACVLGALFLLAVAYAYFFGGIRPIHEWGT